LGAGGLDISARFPALIPQWQPGCPRRDSHYNHCMATRKQTSTNGNIVLEPERQKVEPPPLYKVLLLNDDYTPVDFVVVVLEKFFRMSREQATRVMLKVHHEGSAVCGIFPRDLASAKVEQVTAFARRHQHPLACVMEEN